MKRGLWRGAAILAVMGCVCGIAIACGEELRIPTPEDAAAETTSPNDAATDLTTSTDDAGRSCLCLPPVPDGWSGPIVVDELADCTVPWEMEEGRVNADLDPGAHACSCTCGAPAATCTIKHDNQGQCTSGTCGGPAPMIPSFCYARGLSCTSFFRVGRDAGPCAPDATADLGKPQWTRTARRCKGSTAPPTGLCPDPLAACVAAHAPTAAYCIAHDDKLPCPPSYGLARTYYSTFDDSRGCTPCTCSDGGQPCEVETFGDTGCLEAQKLGTATPNLCTPFGGINSTKLVRQNALCKPVGGEKVGTIVPEKPITVCCRPE